MKKFRIAAILLSVCMLFSTATVGRIVAEEEGLEEFIAEVLLEDGEEQQAETIIEEETLEEEMNDEEDLEEFVEEEGTDDQEGETGEEVGLDEEETEGGEAGEEEVEETKEDTKSSTDNGRETERESTNDDHEIRTEETIVKKETTKDDTDEKNKQDKQQVLQDEPDEQKGKQDEEESIQDQLILEIKNEGDAETTDAITAVKESLSFAEPEEKSNVKMMAVRAVARTFTVSLQTNGMSVGQLTADGYALYIWCAYRSGNYLNYGVASVGSFKQGTYTFTEADFFSYSYSQLSESLRNKCNLADGESMVLVQETNGSQTIMEGYGEGITKTNCIYQVVKNGDQFTVTFSTIKKGRAVLTLTEENETPISGASFDFYQHVDEGNDLKCNNTALVTDADGKIEQDQLEPGTYYFLQTGAPVGYVLPVGESRKSEQFTVQSGQTTEQVFRISMTNQKEMLGSVTLTLTDQDNSSVVLTGAMFELYRISNDGEDEKQGTDIYSTDENGQITVNDLAPGTFYFLQTGAPTGYVLPVGESRKSEQFTVQSGQTAEQVFRISMKNQKESLGRVTLTLTEQDNSSVALSGATFELYRVSTTGEDEKQETDGFSTDDNGQIVVSDLAPGTYYFLQTGAPMGYVLPTGDDAKVEAVISAGKTETQIINLTMRNCPETKGNVTLTVKNNKGEALTGAAFDLYRIGASGANPMTEGNRVNTESLVSDENGEIHQSNLEPGKYCFLETKAPYGYEMLTGDAAKSEEFTIKAGQSTPQMASVEYIHTVRTVRTISVSVLFVGANHIPDDFSFTIEYEGNSKRIALDEAIQGDGLGEELIFLVEEIPVGTSLLFTEEKLEIDGFSLENTGDGTTIDDIPGVREVRVDNDLQTVAFRNSYTANTDAGSSTGTGGTTDSGSTGGSENASGSGNESGSENASGSGNESGSENASGSGNESGSENESGSGSTGESGNSSGEENGTTSGNNTESGNSNPSGDTTGTENNVPSGNSTGSESTTSGSGIVSGSSTASGNSTTSGSSPSSGTSAGGTDGGRTTVSGKSALAGDTVETENLLIYQGRVQNSTGTKNQGTETQANQKNRKEEENETQGWSEPIRETVTLGIRKIWNDEENRNGMRPEQIRLTLWDQDGIVMQVLLYERSRWMATVSNLPMYTESGEMCHYYWTESDRLGYVQGQQLVFEGQTALISNLWERPELDADRQPKRTPGDAFTIMDEYETPMGVDVMINHMGDCFD